MDEKQEVFVINTALQAYHAYMSNKNQRIAGYQNTGMLGATYIQNFHLLKTNLENNEKLDNLNEQISQMNTKFDTLIELLSKK